MASKNDFLIKIGIQPDNAQNQKALNEVLEQARRVLNRELKLNISEGNLNLVLSEIKRLNSSITVLKDEFGSVSSISTSFEPINGKVVSLKTNIDSATQSIRNFIAAGGNMSEVRTAIKDGRAFDIDGNRVTDARRTRSVAMLQSEAQYNTSSKIVSKDEQILNEIIKRYKEIQKIQNSINNSNWKTEITNIKQARTELDKYIEANKKNVDAEKLKEVRNQGEETLNTSTYNQLLNLQNKIRDAKLKELTADRNSLTVLEQKRKSLEDEYKELQKISNLSNRQGKSLSQNQKGNNLLLRNAEDVQKQSNLTKELNNNLNKQISIIKQLNNLDNAQHPQYIEMKEKELLELQKQHNALRAVITDTETLNRLESEYSQRKTELVVQKDDLEDYDKIQKSIAAKKELAQAELALFKVKQQKGTREAVNESEDRVKDATKALNQATIAQLSNGKAVRDSSRYREQANKIEEETATIQRQLDSRYKSSTISLHKMAESLKQVALNVVQYNIAWGVFNRIDDFIIASVHKIRELDAAMTQIRLVTGETSAQVRLTINDYADLAIQLGATTQEVANGSIEWLRQGKTVEETAKLLKASTMLSKLGAIESSAATEKLTAVMNGYKKSAEEAIDVVDKLVNIDLIAATSTEELATSLQYVSSFANMAEVSLDRMIGLIAVGSETTRLSAETIGQGWKSIFSRLENVKAGKNIDDMGESINDTEKVLARFGITLRDSANEFRSMEAVIDDVAAKWNTLGSVEKAQIATAMAGTYQRNTFIATMENYDKVLKYTTESLNSAGTSEEKYGAVLDSIEGKINQFISTWDKMINTFNQGDTFKNAIDAGTELIQVLDFLINDFHIFENFIFPITIISGLKLATSGFIQLKNSIQQSFTEFNSLAKLFQSGIVVPESGITNVKDLFDAFKSTGNISSVVNELKKLDIKNFEIEFNQWATAIKPVDVALQGLILRSQGLTASQSAQLMMTNQVGIAETSASLVRAGYEAETIKAAFAENGLTKERIASLAVQGSLSAVEAGMILSRMGYSQETIMLTLMEHGLSQAYVESALAAGASTVATNAATTSVGGLTGAIGMFTAVWNTSPFVVLTVVIGALWGFVKVIDLATTSFKEQKEAVANATSEYNSASSSLKQLENELKSTSDRLKELNKIEHPTFAEQTEIDKLKDTNKVLEMQVSLMKERQRLSSEKLIQEEEKLLNRSLSGNTTYSENGVATSDKRLGSFGTDLSVGWITSGNGNVNDIVSQYTRLNNTIDKTQAKLQERVELGLSTFEAESQLEYQQKQLQKLREHMLELQETATNYIKHIEEAKEAGEVITASQERTYNIAKSVSDVLFSISDPANYKKNKLDEIIGVEGILDDLDIVKEAYDNNEISAIEYSNAIKKLFDGIAENGEIRDKLIEFEVFTEEDFKNVDDFTDRLLRIYEIDSPIDLSIDLEDYKSLNTMLDKVSEQAVSTSQIIGSAYAEISQSIKDVKSEEEALEVVNNALSNATEKSLQPLNMLNSYYEELDSALMDDISAMEMLNDVVGDLAQGNAMAGNELLDFMDKVKQLPEVYDPVAETTFNLYDNLIRYINETGDATFNNGIVIAENYEAYKNAALSKIEAEKKVAEQIYKTTIAVNESLKEMAQGALNLLKVFNVDGMLSGVNKGIQAFIDNLDAKSGQAKLQYESNLDDIILKESALTSATENFGKTYSNAMKSAANSTRELTNSLKEIQSSINSLLDATMDMLKQEYQDKQDILEDEIDDLEKVYKKEKENIEDLKKQENDRYKKRKSQIEDEAEAIQDNFDKQKEALENELDAYQEKVNLELELLRLKEEERKYDKEVAEKQKDITKIQDQLASIEFDNSVEAQKKKLELAQELAERQEELDELQHDRDIQLQEDALNNELDRFEKEQQGKIDALDKEAERQEQVHEDRLAQLEAEHESYLNKLELRLESIEEEYEYEKGILENKIEDIQNYTSKEVNIRNEAIGLIEGRTNEFFEKLMAWNRDYGTHVDADVIQMWNKAYEALEQFAGENGTLRVQYALETIATQMYNLEKSTDRVATSFSNAASEIASAAKALSDFNNEDSKPKKGQKRNSSSSNTSKNYDYLKSHTGESVVTPKSSPFDNALGLKSNETLRILKVGESVIPVEQNTNKIRSDKQTLDKTTSNKVAKMSKSSRIISNTDSSSLNVIMGDINIEGNADQSTVKALEKERESIIRGVFDRMEKHNKQSGFRNMKLFSI